MKYADAIRDTWRHLPLDAANDHRPLVHYATLAASSHNTQPWSFRIEPGRLTIHPDLSRRCPAVDPDDHHLYASLGCAAENLRIAAEAGGLATRLVCGSPASGVRAEFEPMAPLRSPLFEAIPKRQCTRAEYDGTALSAGELAALAAAGEGDGASVIVLTDKARIDQVAQYVAAGNTAQFRDPAWRHELASWIRFDTREAVRQRDGLYGPVMGSPDVPRWLGELFMRFAFSAERQNAKDLRHIRSSSAIAVFFSDKDDSAHWVEAGRCYQRLALQAAALDLRTAFINQPVEVAALRPQFAAFLGIGTRRPDLIVRIGRGPEMPRSLRRPVEAVLFPVGSTTGAS